MKNLTLALTILIAVTGCQSTSDEPSAVQTNAQENNNVAFNAYQQSKESYDTWLVKIKNTNNLKFYSSNLYNDLLTSWNDSAEIYNAFANKPAKATESYSLFSSGTYAQKFQERLNETQNNYEKLLRLKEKSDLTLAESISQIEYLEHMSAAELFPSEYKSTYSDYLSLFKYVEKNQLSKARTEQVKFLKQAKHLEAEIVLKKYITPLEREMTLLKREGIDKRAPISYARVKTELGDAVAIINSDTRHVVLIEQLVKKVKFGLSHLKNVDNEIKLLSKVRDNKFEPVVLDFENKLLSISSALSRSDYRNQPREKQIELILTAIKELHANKDTERLTTQLEKLQLFNTSQIEELSKLKKDNESLINKLKELEGKTE